MAPRITLIGIGGVHNYGCEAIVRGTVRLLRRRWPNCQVVYVTPRPEADSQRLTDCNVSIVPRRWRRGRIRRAFQSVFARMHVPVYLALEHYDWLERSDAVLSIGGDLYTLNANGRFNYHLLSLAQEIQKRGIPYVVWGASIGPFESNAYAVKQLAQHLSKVDLITAREPLTVEYLAGLGCKRNVRLCGDPAFALYAEAHSDCSPGTLRIAVNLSPLSARYADGGSIRDWQAFHCGWIKALVEGSAAEILLLPHVFAPFRPHDDDRGYLAGIYSQLSGLNGRVRLVDADLGFDAAQRQLRRCDLAVAARMHCAINAISAHVPTVFLSYSQKALGMAQYVYGDSEWCMALQSGDQEAVRQLVFRALDQKANLRAYLAKRVPEMSRSAFVGADALADLLNSRCGPSLKS